MQPVQVVVQQARDGLFQEDGGFSSYGLCCLSSRTNSPYTVKVTSQQLTYIVLDREATDDILGARVGTYLVLLLCTPFTGCSACHTAMNGPRHACQCAPKWLHH
jgi:hypothetical protein